LHRQKLARENSFQDKFSSPYLKNTAPNSFQYH
jgi:hypothetical protein